jgi:hypothetical protein
MLLASGIFPISSEIFGISLYNSSTFLALFQGRPEMNNEEQVIGGVIGGAMFGSALGGFPGALLGALLGAAVSCAPSIKH